MNNSALFSSDPGNRLSLAYVFKLVFFVGFSVVALVSVIGNILAITTFLKRKRLWTSTNYYITSMAVSDLLYVVTDGALYASSKHSVFGNSSSSFGCKLGKYCSIILYFVSIVSRPSIKPGTWNIPEHSGTSRNIPEHEKKINFYLKIWK